MFKKWLHFLWENQDGFFGLGMGSTPEQKNSFASLGNLANFGSSEGEKNTLDADNFFRSILSGDQSKIGQVLGPEISGINKQGQQQKMTASQFGNRSGGTNAGNQMIDDKSRSTIDQLIAQLTGSAASSLGSSGSSLLSLGKSSHEGAFDEATILHQQHEAKINDIFKSIAEVAAGVAG